MNREDGWHVIDRNLYTVSWSEEREQYRGSCEQYPGVYYYADSQLSAFTGVILRVEQLKQSPKTASVVRSRSKTVEISEEDLKSLTTRMG